MRIFIVVPALNVQKNIRAVVKDLHEYGYDDIIVVDDASTDKTAEHAEPFATVLRHPIWRGYGAALKTGTSFALERGADVIVHFDGDGQHRAVDVKQVILPIIESRADIVFGSRYLSKNSGEPLTKRYLIHKPALLVQTVLTGLKFTDIHNGFRALSHDTANRIRIRQDGMAYASEIISEVKRLHLRYVEVPVTILYREYGQGFFGGLKIYKDLIIKKILK